MAKTKLEKPLFNTKDLTLVWEETENSENLVSEVQPDEVSKYSQAAHKRDTQGYDLSQNAMCFEVLGGISLIIGILFIFLSLKKRVNVIIGMNFASLQFVICVICLALAVGLLATGTTLLIKALSKRKDAKKDIAYLGTLSRK